MVRYGASNKEALSALLSVEPVDKTWDIFYPKVEVIMVNIISSSIDIGKPKDIKEVHIRVYPISTIGFIE